MAKMSFSASNKANDNETFPKLKLAQDESARIALFEEPEVGFVHNLRKPKLIGGRVQYKTVKGKNGDTQEMDYEFVGNPICQGNFDILQDRGIDPKNCPACKAASDQPDMFSPPKRRYVVHVFQYNTNGTTQPTKTFQGSVKVWAFTDQKFNELVDLIEEADGDPSKIDIMLGPCENAMFQKYKMVPSMKVKWKEAPEQFQEIVSENKAKNIENFLGRPVKRTEYLMDDLDKVREAWKVANGQEDESASDGLETVERGLDAGLANLLDEAPEQPKEVKVSTNSNGATKVETNNEAVDLEDLLADLDKE